MEGNPAHRGMITISLMLATVMQALDTTIANVALPHIQGALSATQEQAAWILTSYIVASAIMTAPTGILASRLGRKRIFLIAIIGFTTSSALCGLAQNLSEIVMFRVLQGIFGAALVPIAQAVLLDIYPQERHGQAMAMWGVGVMLGPILGPTLGGYLTEYFSWRWVFYINVPVGIAAAFGVAAFFRETPLNKTRRFDFIGFALLSICDRLAAALPRPRPASGLVLVLGDHCRTRDRGTGFLSVHRPHPDDRAPVSRAAPVPGPELCGGRSSSSSSSAC